MAAAFHDGKAGFDNNSKLNAYECDGESGFGRGPDKPGCGAYIVTVDREPGVTPFMVKCGACGQMAHSKFYRVHRTLIATHEWYRPDTLDGLNVHEREHVEKGGLLLRPINDDGWTRPGDIDDFLSEFVSAREAADRRRQHAEKLDMLKSIPQPCDSEIKREDYPNRQQYRAALRADRKPMMKPRGVA